MREFKILIYTDSRGQHVPKGNTHVIYGKQIAKDKRFDVTLCLCKMKWTTTLDFLEYLKTQNIKSYDYDLIILHTGIVEHSPRHKETALNSIYENKSYGKYDYKDFLKRNGGIVNEKKDIFDEIFGEENMAKHLNDNLGIIYEGDETINMYSLNMLEDFLIPELKKIPNLIWISSNKIVPDWNGNYFKERPSNINIIEKYSEKMTEKLPWVIDLNKWDFEEVKRYTCDNMHLSKEGNDYIYNKLMEIIEKKYFNRDTLIVMGNGPSMKKLDISDLRYFDCFGLNLAHRIFDEISFYPKYYGCFDYKVIDCHKVSFQKLINEMPMSRYFFIRNYFKGDRFTYVNLNRLEKKQVFETDPSKIWDLGNSGANSCHIGIALGYKKIILVGVDCSYIDYLPESEKQPNGTLKIIKTPEKNPNYWFDSYQRIGDIYNVPNASKFHEPAWEMFSKLAPKNNITVINCSEGSSLTCFPLTTLKNYFNKTKNIVLTASDEFFFESFIKLVISLKNTEIYKIVLLDIGLSNNNKNLIKQLDIVKLISFEKEFEDLDKKMKYNYFKDNKTYGFKSYLLKNFDQKIKISEEYQYNILYIDSGIYANKSLNNIFNIIQEEDIFCLDHNSEMDYGNIEKKSRWKEKFGGCMLLNMLPPLIYGKLKKNYPISDEGLTKQYIKAGFFGYKYKGKYQEIINDNLKLFKSTCIGLFPVNSTEEKLISIDVKKILKNNYVFDSIYNYKNKKFYESIVSKYLINKKYYSTCWNSHRFDQTILSYLVNRKDIMHKDSNNYIITSYQKSHFIKYIFFHAIYLLGKKDEIETLVDIEYNNYNLSKMNISENLKTYFSQQYVEIKCDDFYLSRKYFSKYDIIYHKYREILEINNFENNYFTDKLYYNLMINWNRQKEDINKKILLKIDNKYAVLHRNNIKEMNGSKIINLLKKQDNKLFIMGNGPSLKEIMDNPKYLEILRKNTTFGLNAAYRAYEKYNFYPNFFGCFDSKVCKHHSKEFEKLILNSPIEKFFFINIDANGEKIFIDPKIINHPKFVDINFILRTPEEKKYTNILSCNYSYFVDMLTSGTNSIQCALIEGYKEIYLLGCDCNYVEIIEGASVEKNTVKMLETPDKNVNYWMDDYQQKGDVFNIPNTMGCQLPAWKRLFDTIICLDVKVKIYNCSNISKITYFEKIQFSTLLK